LNAQDSMTLPEVVETVGDRAWSSVQAKLATVDWSFATRGPAPAIEAIHPYPAKFIGDIPRALLKVLPLPAGTVVFDPFAGSGTTLVEAQRQGIHSLGVDLNPIACLIARVKTSPMPIMLCETARRICAVARENTAPRRWEIPNVNHWFKQDVQVAVAALLHEINELPFGHPHDALCLALSSILVRISNQESDTRYAAVEKSVAREDVFVNFMNAVVRLHSALQSRHWSLSTARVIEANTLTLDPTDLQESVGLVITSPPYPNAYEYWLYHKYRMWWLGFDPLAVKAQEIGARAHFFKRAHHTENNFWQQMRSTFSLIDKVLVRDGYACFLIGRSKIHGRIVDNADIVQAVAAEYGFGPAARFDRVISSNRKSFNLSHANIKTETMLVLERHTA